MRLSIACVSVLVVASFNAAAAKKEPRPRLRTNNRRLETEYKSCGSRIDACAASDGACIKTNLTTGLIEVWEGNPNCADMGFDFGWKTDDPGCISHEQDFSGGYLKLTTLNAVCDSETCNTNDVGSYDLDCFGAEGNQFIHANMTVFGQDAYVLVKGGSLGGSLYWLQDGIPHHNMRTPTGQAISHIEFCFFCDETTEPPSPPAVPTEPPVTATPSTPPPVTDAPTGSAPTTAPPTTPEPTACDTCKADPVITEVPEAKTVCPGDYSDPQPYEVTATDVCGNDLGTSVTASQTSNYPEGRTCEGSVTNAWSVSPPGCEASTPVTATQIITIADTENPTFVDAVLPDLVYICPAQFNESDLVPPFATDNCDKDVAVTSDPVQLEGCVASDITWKAVDNCGNEGTITQSIKITDSSPPLLTSAPPPDTILSCTTPIPPAQDLIFTDNCDGEITANSTDNNVGGSYCVGNVTTRTWTGPSDSCGNSGVDVVQTFTVVDQAPPVMPLQLETLQLTCPSKFDVTNLTAPNATDDCTPSDAITVTGSSAEVHACNPVMVTWTATDQCDNYFNSYQEIVFTDNTAPAPFNGSGPADLLSLKCTDPVPPPETLIFVDDCVDDIEVEATEEDAGGDVCEGKKIVRKWIGPHDDCGNAAEDVYQLVTVVDQEAPVFAEDVDDLLFLCPAQFVADALEIPGATDDCDDVVVVTKNVTKPDVCSNATVTWTAVDECGKESTLTQTISFLDDTPPALESAAPEDFTASCSDRIPHIAPLTFADNCADKVEVEGTESNASGSVCEGQTIVRSWQGPTDDCGNKAENIIQTITLLDQDPPALPETMPHLNYQCPQDFVLANVTPPVATDDCSKSVNINRTATALNVCDDVTITWTATDDCGHTSTIDQIASFVDIVPPAVVGGLPATITVGCGQFPAPTALDFWDFCAGDISVQSQDSLPTGDVCKGQEFVRTWTGPGDACGNKADDVSQNIIVLDESPPDLPQELEDIVLKCPKDFDESMLVVPNATDDCDKTVLVEKTVPPLDVCASEFEVIWTAIDQCSKSDSVAQKVKFSNHTPPSISCPEKSTFTGPEATFTHIVSYGDCFSAEDVTITYEVSCAECSGAGCNPSVVGNGAELTIKDVPAWARVDWVAKLDYGCGVVTAACTAYQTRESETMFGDPDDDEGEKLISEIDDGANRWGWYKEIIFEGQKDYTFTMYAGAGQSDLTKGFEAGTVVVTAKDCAGPSTLSEADWSGIGKAGICITEPEEDGHHLHVGTDLPRTQKGDISFGPGQFNPGCCNVNQTCFIAVHGVVEEARCGSWGCV